jgi:hypothetical protein
MHLVWSAYDDLSHVGKHVVFGTTYPEVITDDGASPLEVLGFPFGETTASFFSHT